MFTSQHGLIGVSSCVFAIEEVMTPLHLLAFVFDRRPDSTGNHVVDVNVEKHGPKMMGKSMNNCHAAA